MKKYTDKLRHSHIQKRTNQKHEPYPKYPKLNNFINRIIYPIGIIGPLMTIPQFVKIWVHQDASSVSVISWSAYLIIAVFWLLYGTIHKEWPIIVSNVLWILMNMAVLVGIFYYG